MEHKLKLLELSQNELMPCYLIESEDSFACQLLVSMIKNKLKLEFEELNVSNFDDENYSANMLYNACMQLPFVDSKRIVVAKNIKISANDDVVISYLKNPSPSTILIFINPKSTVKLNNVCEIDSTLNFREQENIIFQKLKKANKNITTSASKLLIEKCDGSLSKLSNELTKLIYFCEEETIDEKNVEVTVKDSPNFQIFALTNALSEKKGDLALTIVQQMISSKEDCGGMLALIFSNFRRIFLAKSSDLTDAEIATQLGVKPYAISKARQSGVKFPIIQLKKIMYLCEELDYKIKTGDISPLNALYYLIFKIISNY